MKGLFDLTVKDLKKKMELDKQAMREGFTVMMD